MDFETERKIFQNTPILAYTEDVIENRFSIFTEERDIKKCPFGSSFSDPFCSHIDLVF